jgi:lipopolysaccharide export system protein LptA
MKSLIAIAALSTAVALAAQAGAAQAAAAAPAAAPAAGAPAKTSKPPIDIVSDQSETRTADCTTIFTGSPEALQDTSRLRADLMIGHQEVLKRTKAPPKGGDGSGVTGSCGDTISLEAKGNVYYAAPDGRRVHGDDAVYVYATTTITVTGDVTAVDGQNVMRGTKMVYNTKTGEGHMEGGGKGPGAKNRTRGVFYPKDASTDASATASSPGATTDATSAAAPAKPKKKAAK